MDSYPIATVQVQALREGRAKKGTCGGSRCRLGHGRKQLPDSHEALPATRAAGWTSLIPGRPSVAGGAAGTLFADQFLCGKQRLES